MVRHEVTAVGGVYLVDGSSIAFAVEPGDVVQYNIPASHPPDLRPRVRLRSDVGSRDTHLQISRPPRGLVGTDLPQQSKLLPLTLYCQYHGVMGSSDRILAATPPSPPPAAPPAAPITCPAGATSDSLDGLGPTFYYAGTTTHLEDLPGTGATLLFESIEFQCWCGAGLLYELQVDDGTTGTWATVRQCQVTGNVGLGNCPEMPSLANPLTTSYDPALPWRLRHQSAAVREQPPEQAQHRLLLRREPPPPALLLGAPLWQRRPRHAERAHASQRKLGAFLKIRTPFIYSFTLYAPFELPQSHVQLFHKLHHLVFRGPQTRQE